MVHLMQNTLFVIIIKIDWTNCIDSNTWNA